MSLSTLGKSSGPTPLLWVAACGGLKVMNILLNWANVPLNTSNNWGRAPVQLAAELLGPEVTRILWAQGDITLNTLDTLILETNLATWLLILNIKVYA